MPASIISSILQFLSPDLIARIAASFGLDKALVEKTLGAGTPALLAALGSYAERPGGAAAVNAAVARQDPDLLANLGMLVGGSGNKALVDSGMADLKSLLGTQSVSALAAAVGRYAGMGDGGSKSLMGLLGPIVLGGLGQQERSGGLNAAGLLASQKGIIARALPRELADTLASAGIVDGAAVNAAAKHSGADRPSVAYGSTRTRSSAGSGPSWLLPALAAVALAGLAWYLLSSPRPTETAKVAPPATQAETRYTTAAGPEPQAADLSSLENLRGIKVGEVDLGSQVSDAVNGARAAVERISDQASAQSALETLQRSAAELDKLAGLADQLSPEMKKTLAAAIAAARPALNGIFDKALQVPGVSEVIKPAIDHVRSGLDTLATA